MDHGKMKQVWRHQTSIRLRKGNENSKCWWEHRETRYNVDAAVGDRKTGPHLVLVPLQHRSHSPCSKWWRSGMLQSFSQPKFGATTEGSRRGHLVETAKCPHFLPSSYCLQCCSIGFCTMIRMFHIYAVCFQSPHPPVLQWKYSKHHKGSDFCHMWF